MDQVNGRPPLACQAREFSLPEEIHYLNCAYQGPLPRRVEEAGIEGIRAKRDPSGVGPADFFRDSDEVRRRFAALVHAPEAESVAILPSVSYGVATAARNVEMGPGRNIVLVHEQFPGNVYGWRSLAQREGGEIRTVHPPARPGPGSAGGGGTWSDRVLEAIDGDTAVVTLGNVHWADGTWFDLEAIGARAREVGAALVVDGTQSVGALPLDVRKLRPDALIVAGYKWLLGPYSIALGYFGPRFAGGVPLEEGWIARRNSQDFKGLVDYQDEYQPGAIRFDVGERSNFILLPMLREALGLILEWGPDRIQAYCRTLMEEPLRRLAEAGFGIPGIGSSGEGDGVTGRIPRHITGIRMPGGLDLGRVQERLTEARVFASLRGSALRVSPNVYNTPEDVEALVEALTGLRR